MQHINIIYMLQNSNQKTVMVYEAICLSVLLQEKPKYTQHSKLTKAPRANFCPWMLWLC